MKLTQILTCCFLILFTAPSFGQTDYGLQAGIAIDGSGTLKDLKNGLNQLKEDKRNFTGYFVGGYAQFNFLMLYLRPEMQYARYRKNYNDGYYSTSKLELPISIGYKVLPILSLYTGPSFQFLFEQKTDLALGALKKNSTVGVHFGTRVHLGPIGITLRFDRGITANEVQLLNASQAVSGRIDTRPEIWSLGVSFSLD